MNKQTLENAKSQKESAVEKLLSEIKEIDKKIKAIENGPVSFGMYMANEYGISYQDSIEYEFTFDWSDMGKTFRAGEQNHGKRIQPFIDAVKFYHREMEERGGAGFNGVLSALKTLEEYEV